jgi:molybdate transport system ATP-binding protein
MNSFRFAATFPGFRLDAAAEWDAPAAALFGASGSGKTTILEALAGLRRDVAGTATLRDRRLDGVPARARRVGWVPQDAALFPRMSVRENLDFAIRVRGDASAADRAIEVLEIAPLLARRAADLSGGERQRVAIARALASRPEFLLLDEPLASVDRPLRGRIVPFLARLPAATGTPLLVVTHDPAEIATLVQHVVVLEQGRCVASGPPHALFHSATTFGGLGAIGAENRFDVRVVARDGGALEMKTRSGCTLVVAALPGFPEPSHVAVRAEDILLAARRPELVSAQNILAGSVAQLEATGGQVLVGVDVDTGVHSGADSGGATERWVAKVTQRAVAQLGLAPGMRVWLVVKAHAIVPSIEGAGEGARA